MIGIHSPETKFDFYHGDSRRGPVFYDLRSLERFCMGEEEMLAEMLQEIIQLSQSDLLEIKLCLTSGNFQRIKDITHQLSSRLGQIHLPVVTQIKDIEVAIKENKLFGLEKEIKATIKKTEFILEKIKMDTQATVH
jgi:HPt (histidine-containing phosphotransfer) domain-containing protein